MKRIRSVVLAAVVLLTACVGVSALSAGPAAALSASNPMEGTWRNTNTATNSMTRLDVETCAAITTCSGGVCSITYDAGTFVSAWGKCSPSDCAWGRKQAENRPDGWVRATYNFGFKTSYVSVKTYEYYGRTYLRVWVNNDFSTADGRTDYISDEWFLR